MAVPLALRLQAQGHDHVGAFDGAVDVGLDLYRHEGVFLRQLAEEVCRQQRGRRAEGDPGPHLGKSPQVRSGHPAVEDIPHHCHPQSSYRAQVLSYRIQVQERLGGVRVGAVSRVYHRGVDVARDQVRRSRRGMSDDDDVGVHGLHRQRRVVKGLALLDAASCARDVDHVGAQYLARLLEGDPRAGAGLVEEGDNGLAPQGRRLLDIPAQYAHHRVRILQHGHDLIGGEVVQIEDVPPGRRLYGAGAAPPHGRVVNGRRTLGPLLQTAGLGHARTLLTRATSSVPSTSTNRTSTSSSSEVGTFFPT